LASQANSAFIEVSRLTTNLKENAMKTQTELAQGLAKHLKQQPKKEVFAQWQQTCLGRIHNAQIAEQRKSWMIYDIVRAKYNEAIANQVA